MSYSIFDVKHSVKSMQRFFAVLAILALVFGPMNQVSAEDATSTDPIVTDPINIDPLIDEPSTMDAMSFSFGWPWEEAKVKICHAKTGGYDNGKKEVSQDSITDWNGHGSHDTKGYNNTGDIIPPFDVNGNAFAHSQNWVEPYISIYNNDCDADGEITVVKVIIGNTSVKKSDFWFKVGNEFVSNNVGESFAPGNYVVTEIAKPNTPTNFVATFSGDCDANGNVILPVAGNLTCTITNDYTPQPTTGTVTINKTVVNDDQGTANAASFTYRIDGNAVLSNTAIVLNPGSHTVSEDAYAGYTAGSWGGDCAANGSVTVVAGQNKTCTITNDDNEPVVVDDTTVTVKKETDPNGDQTDFSFTLDAGAFVTLSDGETSLQTVVTTGAHALLETPVAGWTLSDVTCVNESQVAVGTEVTNGINLDLAVGDDVVCTFTNTKDVIPTPSCNVTIVSDTTHNKVVEKGNALAQAANYAWTAVINGATWIWGDNPVVDPVGETNQTFVQKFNWTGPVTDAVLDIAADNSFEVKLNGQPIGSEADETNHSLATQMVYNDVAVSNAVAQGVNTLEVKVKNWAQAGGTVETNPAGLLYKLVVSGTDANCDDPLPSTGTLEITKYSCPADTVVTRSQNGVGKTVPTGCVPDAGETFGYVHGTQTDANAPHPELTTPLTEAGVTGVDGILSLELGATGRYLVVETNDANEKLPNNEILGLYCTGDGDLSDNNDNQEITFITEGQVTQCVAYNPADEVAVPQCLVAEENLLLNPSFEEPVIGGDWTILAAVANWDISSDGLELWRNFMGGAFDGVQNAELDGNQSTNISQTVATIPGNEYKVSFAFSPRMEVADNEVEVLVDGVSLGTVAADGTGNGANVWGEHEFVFIAADDSTVVEFRDLSASDSYGTLIDNTGLCMTDENRDGGGGNGDDDYTLTIIPTGDGEGNVMTTGEIMGIACYSEEHEGNDCSQEFASGTAVHLEVDPDAGSNFDSSWTTILGNAGTCLANATSCDIVMNGDVTLEAHFALNGDSSSNRGGGGGGGSRISLSGGGGDDDDEDEPTPQVLGESTSVIPAGAPNTGFGGTSPSNTIATVFGLLAMIFAFGTMKVTKDVK